MLTGVSDGLADVWLRALRRQTEPAARLVCFPHAGGSASFFRDWSALMPADVELVAARYPGREDRIREPLVDTMDALADPLARACSELRGVPLALFGHSMGAAVAYEVARRLTAEPSSTAPVALFVSGYPGPGRQADPRARIGLTDEDLMADMRELGGTDPAAFEDSGLRELFLPAMRADYRIVATYESSDAAAIDCPVVVYYGDQDEAMDKESVRAWSTVSAGSFTEHRLQGGHFYLVQHAADLVRDLLAHAAGDGCSLTSASDEPRTSCRCR